MAVATALRHALPHLDVARYASTLLCEHRLASKSHDLQLRHGRVYGARFDRWTSYVPYTAARPVAPHMRGVHTAGMGGAAAWGASLAVSLLRNELPALTVWYETRVRLSLWAQMNHSAAREPVDAAAQWARLAVYLPLAFSAWEFAFGSGLQSAGANRGPHAVPWYEDLRGPGLVGHAIRGLVRAADARRGTAAEAALVGAACGVTLLNNVPRLVGVVLVGVVAAAGAVFGMVYEVGARTYVLVLMRPATSVSMADASACEQQELQRRMLRLDDEALPAPLIGALWRGAAAYEPNVNFWSDIVQQAAFTVDAFVDPGRAIVEDMVWGGRPHRRRRAAAAAPLARQGAVPLARDMGAGGQNVHGVGRDAATRRSLGVLLQADPVTDAQMEEAYENMGAFLTALEAENGTLAQRMHPCGKTWIQAARFTLAGEAPLPEGEAPPWPRPQYWPPVSEMISTLNVDHHGIVPMKRNAAVIWRAIERLQAADGTTASTVALRRERKEAFVSGLARAVNEDGYRVCQGGQAQRLVLVGQGFVPGVQVEAYDAPVPVPQFVTLATERMHAELGEAPDEEAVARLYNAAYLEGCAVYQGALRTQYRDQLCAVAQALYGVQWVPQ